jgi:hypothetical protein
MESLGTPKVQILLLANHPKKSFDGGPPSTMEKAKLRKLPSLQSDSRIGGTSPNSLPLCY